MWRLQWGGRVRPSFKTVRGSDARSQLISGPGDLDENVINSLGNYYSWLTRTSQKLIITALSAGESTENVTFLAMSKETNPRPDTNYTQ